MLKEERCAGDQCDDGHGRTDTDCKETESCYGHLVLPSFVTGLYARLTARHRSAEVCSPTEGIRYRMQRKLDYWSLNISVSPTARLLGSRSPARGEYQSAQAFAMRARIVLACAEGLSNGAAPKIA